MNTMDIERLTRRLQLSEQEIARAHVEIEVIRRQCRRHGRVRALASAATVAGAFAAASLLSSATTEAQAVGHTVKAPFTVVDAANKPILSVIAAGHRGAYLSRSDGHPYIQLWDEYASITGPLAVTDNAEKPILVVQDSTTTTVKDATGADKPVTTSRGLHLFNGKGDAIARVAERDGDGYVSVRQGGQGSGLGGVQGVLTADKSGSYLGLVGQGKKLNVKLSTAEGGLELFSDSGATRAELNRAHLWLGNEGGDGIVEAGTLPDGRGVVRAGPRMGGALGPGTLNLPFAIMGHK
jgi:hypothetical protein